MTISGHELNLLQMEFDRECRRLRAALDTIERILSDSRRTVPLIAEAYAEVQTATVAYLEATEAMIRASFVDIKEPTP